MVQKLLFCFTNISTEILFHILLDSYFTHAPYFGIFSSYAVAIKSIKNYKSKSFSALALTMLIKLAPGGRQGYNLKWHHPIQNYDHNIDNKKASQ